MDQAQINLETIEKTGTHPDANIIKDLKKRKQILSQKSTSFKVTKGPNFSLTVKKEETDITAEMLASGSWKTSSFKKYNFQAAGQPPSPGHLHPLLKVRDEFRQIFFELG